MRLFFALIALALLASCTTTNSAARGPNGRPVHYIRSPYPAHAYEQAAKLCPNGYDILSSDQQGLIVIITIECK